MKIIISKNGPIGLLQFRIIETWLIDPGWRYAQCEVLFEGVVVGRHMVVSSYAYAPSSSFSVASYRLFRFLKPFISEKKFDSLYHKIYIFILVRNYINRFYYPKLRGIYHNILEEPATATAYLLDNDEVIRNITALLAKR
jgi:hypothetical protein